MLRACLYLLFFVPWTFFCTFFAMLSTCIDRSGKTYHRLALIWSKGCLCAAGIRLIVEGTEHLPHDRPLIFMGNHQSYFDIPVLFQATPLPFTWLAKEELFRIPVFGHSIRAAGYIPINRGNGRDSLKSLNRAAELVKAGRSVAIFPEGTFSGDENLLPFKRGGFILAAMSGVPIAPFSISGAIRINPPGNLLHLSPGVVRIKFSPVIELDANLARHPTLLMEQVRTAIASGLERYHGL
jgi:1-acyl-sn-glycerol-3-phosphate acyltransferase